MDCENMDNRRISLGGTSRRKQFVRQLSVRFEEAKEEIATNADNFQAPERSTLQRKSLSTRSFVFSNWYYEPRIRHLEIEQRKRKSAFLRGGDPLNVLENWGSYNKCKCLMTSLSILKTKTIQIRTVIARYRSTRCRILSPSLALHPKPSNNSIFWTRNMTYYLTF